MPRKPKSGGNANAKRQMKPVIKPTNTGRGPGIGNSIGASQLVNRIVELANELPDEETHLSERPMLRAQFADRAIEAEVGMLFSFRIMTMQVQGLVPNMEASLLRLLSTQTSQKLARVGMEVMGLKGQLEAGSKYAEIQGFISNQYLFAVPYTIESGSQEIQRNVVATRGLGLPRGA